MPKKIAAIVSGGLDSVTLAHKAALPPNKLELVISFDYGQRHRRELEFAEECAERLGAKWLLVDLTSVTEHLKGSALTDSSVSVPNGHYAKETMKKTVVPNRNAMMLSIGFGIAAAHGCDTVATAIHAGDHFIYPDCRPEFAASFAKMQAAALEGLWEVDLWTPFLNMPKWEIAAEAAHLGVPIQYTWSCYNGGEYHCGTCSTCTERREAMFLAGMHDPTIYTDKTNYWIGECLDHGTITPEQAQAARQIGSAA